MILPTSQNTPLSKKGWVINVSRADRGQPSEELTPRVFYLTNAQAKVLRREEDSTQLGRHVYLAVGKSKYANVSQLFGALDRAVKAT